MTKEETIHSLDGLSLPATIVEPALSQSKAAAILVHGGGGVDRHEDGFYTRMADVLAEHEIASLRFDHRAALATRNPNIEVSLFGMITDISSALQFAFQVFEGQPLHLVAASFGGGAAAAAAIMQPDIVRSLVLVNPLLHYRERLLEEKDFWSKGRLTDEGARNLRSHGFLPHGSAIKMGRCLINEAIWYRPEEIFSKLTIQTFILHGTADSRIPIEWSRQLVDEFGNCSLMEFEGADHGLCISDDADFSHPTTREWHARAFARASEFIRENS